MDNETLFYICGGVLAVSAVIVTFLGLRLKDFPGRLLPVIVLWFAIFVGGAATFAVLLAKDEEHAKAAELHEAGEEVEKEETSEPLEEEEKEEEEAGPSEGEGAVSTALSLAADPTALLFDKKELTAKAGTVTINFDNPSAIPHNVVIEKDGKELAGFAPITEGEKSVSADLEAGTYTFLCTVPGHAQAGMEGTLVVK
ncbi:MAG TPA: plastocyanin/azurin family copper-binding protein [Solirubrobacterales bacterium]|nr:plastocyanin/azurin family copper-binding protein [Solirubrobacterales bacterium]